MIRSVFVRRNLPEIKEKLKACPEEVRIYVDYLEGHKENAFELADRLYKLLRDHEELKREYEDLREYTCEYGGRF